MNKEVPNILKMKDKFICLSLMVVIILFIGGCQMPTKTGVILNTPSVVSPGGSFLVSVRVEPAQDVAIAGMQVDIKFNPLVLKVDKIIEGNFLKQSGVNETFFILGSIDNLQGKITGIMGMTLFAGHVATEAGTFIILECTALLSGSSSFELVNVLAGDKNGVVIPLDLLVNQVVVAELYDIDLNDVVDESDLLLIAGAFGLTGIPGWRREDVNKDGVVNVLDAILVGQHHS
jgi:hypothetical protein